MGGLQPSPNPRHGSNSPHRWSTEPAPETTTQSPTTVVLSVQDTLECTDAGAPSDPVACTRRVVRTSITNTKEQSTPTPSLKWDPQDTDVDLVGIAPTEPDIMFRMMTHITRWKKIRMHWYQLQQLGQWAQWTPELLRNIETIDVTIDADTSDITEASVNWLHRWATSVTHTRRLRCVIPRWTVAIQRGFARSKNRIGMHTWNVNGLIGFDLVIESLDPQLMQNTRWVLDRDLMQGEMIWGRFVSMNTHITLSFHARKVDPWTMRWLESLLQGPTCYGKGMVAHVSLDCLFWDAAEMPQAICTLIWNYSEKKAYKILNAYKKIDPTKEVNPDHVPPHHNLLALTDHQCVLHIHVQVPKYDTDKVKTGTCHNGTIFGRLVRQQMVDQRHITMRVTEHPHLLTDGPPQ